MTSKTIVLLAASLILLPATAMGGGPVHGAKAAGMGTTFVAVADDPSTITHNPAGLANLNGTQVYGGATPLTISSRYTDSSGGKEDTDFQVFLSPHLYVVSDLGTKDFRFGVGQYSPFGVGGRKWDDHGLTRYASVESLVGTFTVNPTVAYRISPMLSVGLGADYMISQSTASMKIDQSALGAGDADLSLKNYGNGWGWNAGLLFTPHEKFSIGAAYRSGITVDYDGKARLKNIAPPLQPAFGGGRFRTDTRSKLRFPEIFSLGFAYRPTSRLTLGADVERVRWSSFDKMKLDLKNEVPAAGFTDTTTRMDWRDVWLFKAGVNYQLAEKWAVRAGYSYVEAPVPSHTLGPDCPDSEQHDVSIGFGYSTARLVVDAFYTRAFYESRKVNNSRLSGRYENSAQFLGLSVGYKF